MVVVVDCPVEVAVERLVTQRSFTRQDALARVAHQASREKRRAGADYVIDNAAGRPELEEEVGRLWVVLQARAESKR